MSIRPLCSPRPADSLPDCSPAPRPVAVSVRPNVGQWLLAVQAWFTAGALALVALSAWGQQPFAFDSIPLHEKLQDAKLVKSLQTECKNYASTGVGRTNLVFAYIGLYVTAKMTAPDGVQEMSALMEETNGLLLRAQRSNRTQVWQQLTQYVFTAMKKVAEGNYHPAARINAALILSRLDRQPANTQNRTPPVPLVQTFPILMKLYQDENNVDGVRAAALQGLHRHVVFGSQIAANDRTTLQTAMTQLLESPPPAGRSPQAHAYLQRYAVDILEIFRPQQDASLGVKLISISTEPKNPDLIALYSAARLGAMGATLQGQVNAPETVIDSWSRRVLDAFETELARIQNLDRPKPDSSQPQKPERFLEKKTAEKPRDPRGQMGPTGDMNDMEMMDMGSMYDDMMMQTDEMSMDDMQMQMMMGGGMGRMAAQQAKPQPPEVLAARRVLNTVLQQVHLGMTGAPVKGLPTKPGGLLASAAADKKPLIEAWVTAMDPIITAINDPLLDDRKKFVEGLETQVAALREYIGIEDEAVAEAADGLPAEVDPLGLAAPAADELAPAPADELAPAPADELAPAPADELAPAPADELAP